MTKQIIVTPCTLLSLEDVAQRFEQWRTTRVKRSKIPTELWALVAPLMNQYGHNKIAKALRVNHAQLKENARLYFPIPQQRQDLFVECPLPVPPASSVADCIVEVTCKNGSAVKISGFPSMQIQSLISSLIGNGL